MGCDRQKLKRWLRERFPGQALPDALMACAGRDMRNERREARRRARQQMKLLGLVTGGRNEHVHHKNHDPFDNSLRNLVALPASEHRELHRRRRRQNRARRKRARR